MNNYNPLTFNHPGITLREKLDELDMGSKEFSVRTGKPEKTISAILNCESSITPDMAILFENVLKIPARFWLNYQQKYNEALAKQKSIEAIKESIPWSRKFPYTQMAKFRWIAPASDISEKVENLLKYFGVSSHYAWEQYYFEKRLKIAFRLSLKHTNEAPAISAWLRRGEILSQNIEAPDYNEKRFRDTLYDIKSVMATHPPDFFSQLKSICLSAGVKVVYTQCLPKAPINGCSRWINDTPLIQLSGRYKRNDIFWFTFFHEVGHIILHGKKDIFLEKVKYEDFDENKENESDEFAIEWTLNNKQEKEILMNDSLDVPKIFKYAEKFNTNPAIIIGRLQHKKIIDFSIGRNLLIPVNFEDDM